MEIRSQISISVEEWFKLDNLPDADKSSYRPIASMRRGGLLGAPIRLNGAVSQRSGRRQMAILTLLDRSLKSTVCL